MKLPISDSDSTDGCKTWPTEMRMVRWAMWVGVLGVRRTDEILEEARVGPIVMVMRRRRLEWFGNVVSVRWILPRSASLTTTADNGNATNMAICHLATGTCTACYDIVDFKANVTDRRLRCDLRHRRHQCRPILQPTIRWTWLRLGAAMTVTFGLCSLRSKLCDALRAMILDSHRRCTAIRGQ